MVPAEGGTPQLMFAKITPPSVENLELGFK